MFFACASLDQESPNYTSYIADRHVLPVLHMQASNCDPVISASYVAGIIAVSHYACHIYTYVWPF
jgi:hypothetical protein